MVPQQQRRRRRRAALPRAGERRVVVARGAGGFGFTIAGQRPCVVSAVAAGGPAERAGLRAGDALLAVDGASVARAPHASVARLVAAAPGAIALSVAPRDAPPTDTEDTEPDERARTRRRHPPSRHHRRLHPVAHHPGCQAVPSTSAVSEILQRLTCAQLSPSHASRLECRAVVGYLGTIETPQAETAGAPGNVRIAVRKLRQERRGATPVLLSVLPGSLLLRRPGGQPLAQYARERIVYAGCPSDADRRYFGLVTAADAPDAPEAAPALCTHVFAVDPRAADHEAHTARARDFHISCTRDPVAERCLEFPPSAEYVVGVIRGMYSLPPDDGGSPALLQISKLALKGDSPASGNFSRCNRAMLVARDRPARHEDAPGFIANSPQPSNHSEITTTSSNSDSGIGFHNDGRNIADRIVVVDFAGQPPTLNRFRQDMPRRPVGLVGCSSFDADGSFLSNTTPVVDCFGGQGRPLNLDDVLLNAADLPARRLSPRVDYDAYNYNHVYVNAPPSTSRGCNGALYDQVFTENEGHYELLPALDATLTKTLNSVEIYEERGCSADSVSVYSSRSVEEPRVARRRHMQASLDDMLVLGRRDQPDNHKDDAIFLHPAAVKCKVRKSKPLNILSRTREMLTGKGREKEERRRAMSASAGDITGGGEGDGGDDTLPAAASEPDLRDTQSEQTSPFRRWTTGSGASSSYHHADHRALFAKQQMSEGGGEETSGSQWPNGGVARWSLGLEHLLKDPAGGAAFAAFLRREYAHENLAFWHSCESYVRAADNEARESLARQIWERHLAEGAAEPVNVDAGARRSTMSRMNQFPPPPDLFNQGYAEYSLQHEQQERQPQQQQERQPQQQQERQPQQQQERQPQQQQERQPQQQQERQPQQQQERQPQQQQERQPQLQQERQPQQQQERQPQQQQAQRQQHEQQDNESFHSTSTLNTGHSYECYYEFRHVDSSESMPSRPCSRTSRRDSVETEGSSSAAQSQDLPNRLALSIMLPYPGPLMPPFPPAQRHNFPTAAPPESMYQNIQQATLPVPPAASTVVLCMAHPLLLRQPHPACRCTCHSSGQPQQPRTTPSMQSTYQPRSGRSGSLPSDVYLEEKMRSSYMPSNVPLSTVSSPNPERFETPKIVIQQHDPMIRGPTSSQPRYQQGTPPYATIKARPTYHRISLPSEGEPSPFRSPQVGYSRFAIPSHLNLSESNLLHPESSQMAQSRAEFSSQILQQSPSRPGQSQPVTSQRQLGTMAASPSESSFSRPDNAQRAPSPRPEIVQPNQSTLSVSQPDLVHPGPSSQPDFAEPSTRQPYLFGRYLHNTQLHPGDTSQADVHFFKPKAQRQIYNMMRLDLYPRFLRSGVHAECARADLRGLPPPYSSPVLSDQTPSTPSKLKKSASNASERRRSGGASLLPWRLRVPSRERSGGPAAPAPPATGLQVHAGALPLPSAAPGHALLSVPPLQSVSPLPAVPPLPSVPTLPAAACHTAPAAAAASAASAPAPLSTAAYAAAPASSGEALPLPLLLSDVVKSGALCRVVLPDGATSVVGVDPNVPVRRLVDRLLTRRNLLASAANYDVLLKDARQGEPSVIDGGAPSSALGGREVLVERRCVVRLEVRGRCVAVRCRPARRLRHVLRPVLARYAAGAATAPAQVLRDGVPLHPDTSMQELDGARLQIVEMSETGSECAHEEDSESLSELAVRLAEAPDGAPDGSDAAPSAAGRVRAALRQGPPLHHHPPDFLDNLRETQRVRLGGKSTPSPAPRAPPPLPPKPARPPTLV